MRRAFLEGGFPMRCVIQRVTSASVAIDGEVVGKCGKGYMILIGVSVDDTEKDLDYMATKIPPCASSRMKTAR